MADRSSSRTKVFRGLNNVADPLRLGLAWLATADNVNITSRNAVERCDGFSRTVTASALTGAYATQDLQRAFIVDSGSLKQLDRSGHAAVLATGLSSAPTYFTEIDGKVFYANGVDFGVIENGTAQPWGVPAPAAPTLTRGTGVLTAGTYSVVLTNTDGRGIESGSGAVATIAVPAGSSIAITGIPQDYDANVYVTAADGSVYYQLATGAGASVSYNCAPEALGMELPFWNFDTPRGTIPAFWGGQMFIAEYIPEADMSVIWASQPLGFHHFDLGDDAIAVPGQVRMLRGVAEGLVLGTDRKIYAYTGEALSTLAEYGVTSGFHDTIFNKQVYFWSLRGMCRALPFENLTQNTVSVAPGLSAGAAVIEKDGMRRYVVALRKGGTAYNKRT